MDIDSLLLGVILVASIVLAGVSAHLLLHRTFVAGLACLGIALLCGGVSLRATQQSSIHEWVYGLIIAGFVFVVAAVGASVVENICTRRQEKHSRIF